MSWHWGAGDVRAVNDSGLLHEGLLFFFFLSPWRNFFPSSPAVLLRKGIFRTKLPPASQSKLPDWECVFAVLSQM